MAPPVAEISEAVAASVNQTFAAEDEEKLRRKPQSRLLRLRLVARAQWGSATLAVPQL